MMTETVVTVEQPSQRNAAAPGANKNEGAATFDSLGLKFNPSYFIRTVPGILKLVQLVLGILCMALASPAFLSATHFFLFVAVTAFIVTICWAFVYLLGLREALKLPINWILSELIGTAIYTALYVIAFIVQLSAWSKYLSSSYGYSANIAAGSFGIFISIAYGLGTFFLFKEWKGTGQ